MLSADEAFAHKMAKALATNKADALVALAGVCVALLQRIDRLEQRDSVEYRGVWQAGQTYDKGSLVTLSGSLWHAQQQTSSRPGGADGSWKLSVKRGTAG